MRNICSLFFYELLNVIKVSNQIVGKVFLATRVVRRLKGFVGCNSWQSGTGRAERATAGTCYHFQFSSHTELVFVMRAELMRGGLQHEDTSQQAAGWRHCCQGQGVGAPGLQMVSGQHRDGSWHPGHCVNMTGAFQQHWGMTMDTLIAHVLKRGNSGWNKSYCFMGVVSKT